MGGPACRATFFNNLPSISHEHADYRRATVVAHGYGAFLQTLSDQYTLYEAASLDKACDILMTNHIQMVISEISIGGKIGAILIDILRRVNPEVSILFYSALPEKNYALSLMRAGADGFISKQATPRELAGAISKIASGGKYLSAG